MREKSAFPSARDVTEYDDVDTSVLDIAFPHGKTNFSQNPLAITFVTGKLIDVMLTPSISFPFKLECFSLLLALQNCR